MRGVLSKTQKCVMQSSREEFAKSSLIGEFALLARSRETDSNPLTHHRALWRWLLLKNGRILGSSCGDSFFLPVNVI